MAAGVVSDAIGGAAPAGDPTLENGSAALALARAYLERAGRAEPGGATRWLEASIDEAARRRLPITLHDGWAGIGWTTEHLRPRGQPSSNQALDRLLAAHAPGLESADLVGGLIGVGVYALERLPSRAGAELLERVVESLAGRAERAADGVRWPVAAGSVPLYSQETCYFPGVAHGAAGAIGLLAAACAAGIAAATARPLLDGTVGWLLARSLPPGSESRFPRVVAADAAPEPRRDSWCHGDPAIALVLLSAARAVGEPGWEAEALATARAAAERPVDATGQLDASLCHGAAGLGHVFNRLFQLTGEPSFALAAERYFERTLALADPAGYLFRIGEEGTEARVGLRIGSAGVALALLAAASDLEPAWDRLFLLSIKRRGRAGSLRRPPPPPP